MAYKAIITTIAIRPHPGADRLELAVIDTGEQVVVGKGNYKDGDRVIYCAEGGQLSPEYCYNNNEYRENHGINKDPGKFGFFDEKCRVKIIKLRGEISNGYLIPFSAFDWLGPNDLAQLSVGTELDTINDHQFCEKYFTRATRERMAGKPGEQKTRCKIEGFEKHFDTSQLARHYKNLPDNAIYYISEKIHATSGRTGYLTCKYNKPLETKWEKLQAWFMNLIGQRQTTETTGNFLVTGTRNTDQNPLVPVYGDGYRQRATELFKDKLRLGETVFYELCYTNKNGGAVQKTGVNKNEEYGKEVAKAYGQHIEFTYGVPKDQVTIFIYRMTQQIEGREIELSWNQILRRIREIGHPDVRPVPYSEPFCSKSEIHQRIQEFIGSGKSTLDNHPMEGICLRIEHSQVPKNMSVLKFKTDLFCWLEGIAKNDDNFVDEEEIS